MSDYTPTADEVRAAYKSGAHPIISVGDDYRTQEVMGEEFDRWLAQHDAEILRGQAVEVYALSEEMHRRADLWEGKS